MQNIICQVPQCGWNSKTGFCLKKNVHINNQGVCTFLTRSDWNFPVENKYTINGVRSLKVAERKEGEQEEKEFFLPGQDWQV